MFLAYLSIRCLVARSASKAVTHLLCNCTCKNKLSWCSEGKHQLYPISSFLNRYTPCHSTITVWKWGSTFEMAQKLLLSVNLRLCQSRVTRQECNIRPVMPGAFVWSRIHFAVDGQLSVHKHNVFSLPTRQIHQFRSVAISFRLSVTQQGLLEASKDAQNYTVRKDLGLG